MLGNVCRATTLNSGRIRPLFSAICSPSAKMLNAATMKRFMTVEHGKKFIDKNVKLNRPVSPHLSIYKMELPPLLSGSHRTTGFIFTVMSVSVATMSFLPWNWATILETMRYYVPYPPIVFAKFGCVAGVSYHFFNGIRHLVWDLGYGFKMPTLYKTGYLVIALALLNGLRVTVNGTQCSKAPGSFQ
uniref:Succinate dehydrogenase cytochrome b560 subunit, mitochondrial n=1 Tax=Salmo salar TaxID=8030 RepID=B9ENP3_SALSA|nr:Succinate dehydrogenase cytochrome b560 subunit, mitochondrial precursor [Salmo salar]